ncbi:hypothetical protein SESBI_36788 [Sesbania bispinosa]|nr:hypothetical protein SESBI_36788 [Sesbania bispinosa]
MGGVNNIYVDGVGVPKAPNATREASSLHSKTAMKPNLLNCFGSFVTTDSWLQKGHKR